jgi:hypothetical protein
LLQYIPPNDALSMSHWALSGGGGGDTPWWVQAESRSGDNRGGLERDLFLYVDTVAFGRRKDTRVKVQLREDDLDIDAPGVPAFGATSAAGGGLRRADSLEAAAVNGNGAVALHHNGGAHVGNPKP